MKKILNKILLLALIMFFFAASSARAEEAAVVAPPSVADPVAIHLSIATASGSIYDADITVNACNSDNGSTEELKVTAYCAILQSGIESVWDWSWAPGAFVSSINGVSGFTTEDSAGSPVYHYWSWSLNSNYAETSLNEYQLSAGDLISLDFVDPAEEPEPEADQPATDAEETPPAETPAENPPAQSSGGSGGGSNRKNKTEKTEVRDAFDTEKAFKFLVSEQAEDGSFGEDIYTDWAALALASGNYQEETLKLVKYFGEQEAAGMSLTDYERRAMALLALGLNPYNTNGENYIEKIAAAFDGKQFGDGNEDNDDIFALIVLSNAGFTGDDRMMADALAFVLGRQQQNGSWDGSVDMTGAGIQALSVFKDDKRVEDALKRARLFLAETQKDDGGWGNVSSTAWAIGGILALDEKPEEWVKNKKTPLGYLAESQDKDGGIKNENVKSKIWETAYAVSAKSGRTWSEVMKNFHKPKKAVAAAPSVPRVQATEQPKVKALSKSGSVKKENPKAEKSIDLAAQNMAAPIVAVEVVEVKKSEGWFSRFFRKVFGR